jgi:hypothetical protein
MPIRDPQALLQKFGQSPLKVDTYFLHRTGFVANQTILKLGEYNLNCVPATLGVEESRFLAVLTPVEVNHFARFKVGTHILILTFNDPENKDIARFHLRVTLVDLVPVPDRKNVCFLLLKLKSLPAEFILFLGDYLEALDVRKESWETLAAEPIDVTAASLEHNAVVTVGDEKTPVGVTAFHTKLVRLTWPEGAGVWAGRSGAHLRLTVRGQLLVLEGRLDSEGAFLPEFHSEWLDFIEDTRFHKTLKNRPGAKAAS